MTLEEFEALAEQVNNWGRWGDDDQRGTLNFISPEVVTRAAESVRTGQVFSLAMTLSLNGPQDGSPPPGRINPVRTMLAINTPMSGSPNSARYSDDIVVTPTQTATHWDALAHTTFRGTMYNGFPETAVDASGATKLGIEAAGEIVSRGVLLDVARHQGLDVLPGRFAVTRAVLQAVEEAQGSPVERGDIVLVRTGQASFFLQGDVPRYRRPLAACDYDTALYFHEREVAAVAIDNAPFELLPANVEEVVLPLHVLNLVYAGLMQGENFVLEELATACAQDRRYTFLLNATPERFLRSTGGLVNPVAIR
ncbi:cyclase family protein [Nonomuraea sp. NPDC005650]|uniref:cyclase family protein n=1 Tax=Nonomuraea sp. NPDC005650 TaxID=3157045 RepID=UPI0033BC2013